MFLIFCSKLYHLLNSELCVAVDWFRNDGMLTNPDQWVLNRLTNLDFTFVIDGIIIERRDNIDLLGINIDSLLSFERHITSICSKVNNQLQVMRRFKNLASKNVRARVYKAFILPFVFQYCSAAWNFCGVHNSDKLELLNKQRLRLVLYIYSSLLNELGFVSSRDARIQDMLTLVYKCLVNMAPFYLTSLSQVRISKNNLDLKSSLCGRWPRILLD